MPSGQIEGLASNLNTTEIVKGLMQYERFTIQRMEVQKLAKTQQMSVLNTISAKLIAFKTKAAQLSRLATFDTSKVVVSNEDYLTATVNGTVSEGQYNISIDQLALNHQIATQGFESGSSIIGTGTFSIKIGDSNITNITIDSGNNTLEGLKDAINEAKAGVKAALVNDGSSSNSYRLILTSEKTGKINEISITSSLSGGTAPDFSTSSFDDPEIAKFDSGSNVEISLGSNAAYTGSTNKKFSFTVQGSGTQTIGTDAITINWSDGTDSGSFEIAADYVSGDEIALTGDGSDGLTLSFSEGTLTSGDTFKVQTFAPLLQSAQDAKVSLGSMENGGSPIEVISSNNVIKDLIPGVTLTLNKITNTETPSIRIGTSIDTDVIKDKINEFLGSYNDAMAAIEQQFKFSESSEEVGVLFGDSTLRNIQSRLRSSTLFNLTNVDGDYKILSQLGIRHNTKGQLQAMNPSDLSNALEDNLSGVIKFFANSASSSNSKISYLSASTKTEMPESGFVVEITRAATSGYLKGITIADPSFTPLTLDSTNYKIKLRVDGLVSEEIALTQKTYNSFEELATEIQNQIDQDDKIGGRGIEVEFMDLGETGYLKINSASYGSSSTVGIQAGVEDSALKILGLAEGLPISGQDVEGTINGEKAEGSGQILRGLEGNQYSDGLEIKVEYSPEDIAGDHLSSTLTLVKGFATQVDELLDMYTAAGEGVIAGRVNAFKMQIDTISTRMAKEEERLQLREKHLFERYYELEQTLAQWKTTESFLTSQIANLNSNWNYGRG